MRQRQEEAADAQAQEEHERQQPGKSKLRFTNIATAHGEETKHHQDDTTDNRDDRNIAIRRQIQRLYM